MFPTGTIVTIVTTDRIRSAENARRANSTSTAPAKPMRTRCLRRLATRVAAPGLR